MLGEVIFRLWALDSDDVWYDMCRYEFFFAGICSIFEHSIVIFADGFNPDTEK